MTSASETSRTGPGAVSEDRTALYAGIGCYALWSVLSLQFMALAARAVDPWEILAHRCIWALPWAAGILWLARAQGEVLAVLCSPRLLGWLVLSATLVSVNWGIFIVAATTGHKLDASLAYYINPLLNMAAGALLFRERFTRSGAVAIALAVIGVVLQAVAVGHPPWMALVMATTFGLYGVIRKRLPVGAQAGLLVEALLLAPLGLAYVLWLHGHGAGHFGSGALTTVLILSVGPSTAIPLAMFAYAARGLPLSTMGFLQFILPTLVFGIAMATGESLTPLRALSFVFIWIGVAVFSAGSWAASRAQA